MDAVTAFTPVTKVMTLNPDEPDPTLQNRIRLRKLNAGARAEMTGKTMRTTINTATNTPDVTIDVAAWRLELVKHCVVSWEGPLFGDAPAIGSNIEQLDTAIFDAIAAEVESLNEVVSDATKKL